MELFDLHQHVEWNSRLNGLLSSAPIDWPARREGLSDIPTGGLARLQYLFSVPSTDMEDVSSSLFEEVVADALEDAAAAGARFTQLRLPQEAVALGSFMEHFKLALKQVQRDYPDFQAGAMLSLNLWDPTAEEVADVLPDAASEGLAGIELLYVPYAAEADWSIGRILATSAAESGLEVSVPVGAFTDANMESVLQLDGVSRIGHGVHAVGDERFLQQIRERSISVEICLTSAILLGMVDSPAGHPIHTFLNEDIDVVLGTDSPLRLGTSIAHEYDLARTLGVSDSDLDCISRRASTLMSIAI
ncbi:hypothetical protein [Haloglycomyces albus]|uniref:hypothetical protein n=1 Tax=Haloglycomyces albus TaxID=526067 RepID=UPI00046D58A5|nr:hypothetical protein [Haloglycomyces albus]